MIINTSPILNTLLDTDAYKLHMQQAVFHYYPDVSVKAVFQSRDGGLSADYIGEIQKEVEAMSSLMLTEEENYYLANLLFFKPDYLNWLKDFRFDPKQVNIQQQGEQFAIEITGLWQDVIMWEVPLLAIISEIVHRDRSPSLGIDAALSQLRQKIREFYILAADLDLSHFRLVDFGTRRRFSRDVHAAVVKALQRDFPYLIGTSNYHLARCFDLAPIGTQAHEWFQAHQQISPSLRQCQRLALKVWLDEYPDKLGIALTDCISMDAFLRDFDDDFAHRYQGLRHDSGDPILWGEKALKHYEKLGIDPQTKTLVFSDHLNFEKTLQIYRHFLHRTRLVFGMGTKLTCDLPQVTPLNMVIKLVECQGRPVAKLSDTPGKTLSIDPEFTLKLREAFQH